MELVADTFNLVSVADKKAAGLWPPPGLSTLWLSQLIAKGPASIVGLEIGTLGGESAFCLLENCPNIARLYTVDPYREYTEWIGRIPQSSLDAFEALAKQNLARFGDRVVMCQAAPAMRFDFAFIDGAHDYQSVLDDLAAYCPRVKAGGVVALHDYNFLPGVRLAVRDYRNAHGITSPLKELPHDVCYWIV